MSTIFINITGLKSKAGRAGIGIMACMLIGLIMPACQEQYNELPTYAINGSRKERPQGSLYIIGGSKRTPEIVKDMARSAAHRGDYCLVFPHSGAEPDSSFYYIARDFEAHTTMRLVNISDGKLRTSLIDSVRAAPLIFITGGDQNRFLERVHPAVRRAIREAYYGGATVGGTSAGAALMGAVMITGDQRDYPFYESTYARLHHGNGIYAEGLGLVDSIIIDQHFIARSRYNRLISALADTGYPYAAGVEEETALLIHPEYCTVVGDKQVVLMERPLEFKNVKNRIGLRNMPLHIHLPGDTFHLKQQYP